MKIFLLLFSIFIVFSFANDIKDEKIEKQLYSPLIERYILDELKEIRIDHHRLRSDVEQRISRAEVTQTDRSARYITDTIGNIFYLIAAATSILIFAGWNSLRDIKKKTEDIVEARVEQITQKYNEKLDSLQDTLTEQSKRILENQNKIYNTQFIHSLWMRSNLETNPQSRIDIYDEIIKLNNNDAEVYAYKADAVLEIDEYEWALNLSNKAIEIDDSYGYAYWQRSCANAELGNLGEAISDLELALQKSPNLKDDVENETSFSDIKDTKEFRQILSQIERGATI
ncbi:MAG: tetratricopeptide repeat protein [Sulfurimonas sp.]|uniref:tetratricopeptide repeat protein n=1 Tax=Sulfurimonas sp. TaxID=2022749 RepID=UPI0025EF27A7|nr:tetratricopeptide repeat protein [Sulfurimonas sp.]MCK9492108.1 tetratricopeptide repeat protein [Sulfurimonas sp.]